MNQADNLNELNKALELYQVALKLAEDKLDSTMKAMDQNVETTQLKKVQKTIMNLNVILKKAKKGQNVDKEIKAISEQFKQEQ